MELLQSREYKPDEITSPFIKELKILVESIVEVCTEGEISCLEAIGIITKERDCSILLHMQLLETLGKRYDTYELLKLID